MTWIRRLAVSTGLAVAAVGLAVPLSLSASTASATDVPVASVSALAEGRAPKALRADLRSAWKTPDGQRLAALQGVLKKAVDGGYGAQVQARAKKLQRRLEGMDAALRADLEKAIELPKDQRQAAFKAIRAKIQDGGYGEQVKRNQKLLKRARHHKLFG